VEAETGVGTMSNGMGVGGMEVVILAEHWWVFWYAVWRARVELGVQT
jgi:hypothetical protein